VQVPYKQTVLGAAWAIVLPLFMAFIFTMVFGRFARLPSRGYAWAALTGGTRVMGVVRK
jgi:homopolymeric O-antigen transport system permease protein